MSPTDEDLFLDGNEAAMTKLVGRYERPLYRFILSLSGDPHQASDYFQETFLRLHRARGQFQSGARLKPYLYRIALNVVRDARRQAKTHPQAASLNASVHAAGDGDGDGPDGAGLAASREPHPPDAAESGEARAAVRHAVARLPEHEREVVVLRVFEDLTFAQIADITGVPVATAKSRMLYALRRLRPLLERHLGGAV